jgi:hypothetical protein
MSMLKNILKIINIHYNFTKKLEWEKFLGKIRTEI